MNKPGFDFDVAVIGGGSGGYAAARSAAAAGLRTVVVEGGDPMGGLCILRGCMPTKALMYAAEIRHLATQAETWGIKTSPSKVDLTAIMARKDRLIADFASYRQDQLADGRFTLIRSMARFQDSHTLALSNGNTLTAGHFVISTGSRISPPPLPCLQHLNLLTSDEAIHLQKLPESLIILGGGAIACEFAQFFARLDVQVTLIQRSNQLLKDFDPDAAATVEQVFRREGVNVFTGTKLTDATQERMVKRITFDQSGQTHSVEADAVMHALGRSPNTESLALDRAGVATNQGRIITNARMQTSASHIYAAGDCTGPHEIVHIAIQQGELAIHNILHADTPGEIDYRLLTSVVFTDPQVSTVGLTEKAAKANGIDYRTASYPFGDHGKSLIMEALDGFVKLLADPLTGEILGGCCVGPVGGELIHEIIAAMHKRMTVHELAAMPHYHPTLAEIWTYPAEELAGQIPTSAG